MSLHHGDCLEVMAGMEPESVDAIVTDPPYGLEFMGKEWDKLGATLEAVTDSPGMMGAGGSSPFGGAGKRVRYGLSAASMQQWHQQWAEAAYRVAKPSSYLLAFGGTRTVHRMTCAIEDAGWVVRDMLVWAYASGFPKSKASLKPAWEPIVMARKPGPLRDLAIDACRIPGALDDADRPTRFGTTDGGAFAAFSTPPVVRTEGRWPANVILTDPIFDGGIEGVVGGGEALSGWRNEDLAVDRNPTSFSVRSEPAPGPHYGDSGTYSRFFLIPKSSRSDREPVLGGLADGFAPTMGNGIGGREHDPQNVRAYRQNVHPTVKPTDLMRHLVRLVTPTGGTVLDPFLGSGTTALAAEMEGFGWVGIEREAEYVAIAEARLNGVQRGLGLEAS